MALSESLVIGVLVFTPLVVVLWFVYRKYAYPYTKYTYFSGQKITYSLAAGIVIGSILFGAWVVMPLYYVVNAIMFALLEEIIRLVILNLPIFQMKFDTTFYGAALGGGTATMVVAGFAYRTLYNPSVNFWEFGLIITLVVFSFSVCLLNISNGAMIGYGCGKGLVWSYTARAIIAHIAFNMMLIPGVLSPNPADAGILFYVSAVSILAMSLLLFIYVYRNIIENVLPDNLRKQRRREIRAMARGKVTKKI